MQPVKVSVRSIKLKGDMFSIGYRHNSRTVKSVNDPHFPKSADKTRTDLNRGYKNKTYQEVQTTSDLVALLKEMYLLSKSAGTLPKGSRFPRLSSTYKKKNGEKITIDTSFSREFIFQIGKEGLVNLPDKQYLEIMRHLENFLQNDIIGVFIHRDETSEHVHIMTTHWCSKLSRFNNWFRQKNSMEILQDEMNQFIKKLLVPYAFDVLPQNKKSVTGDVHIPYQLYKRYLEPLDKKIAHKKEVIGSLDMKLRLIEELKAIVSQKYADMLHVLEEELHSSTFKESVIEEYKLKIQVVGIAAALTFIEVENNEDYVAEGEKNVFKLC